MRRQDTTKFFPQSVHERTALFTHLKEQCDHHKSKTDDTLGSTILESRIRYHNFRQRRGNKPHHVFLQDTHHHTRLLSFPRSVLHLDSGLSTAFSVEFLDTD